MYKTVNNCVRPKAYSHITYILALYKHMSKEEMKKKTIIDKIDIFVLCLIY